MSKTSSYINEFANYLYHSVEFMEKKADEQIEERSISHCFSLAMAHYAAMLPLIKLSDEISEENIVRIATGYPLFVGSTGRKREHIDASAAAGVVMLVKDYEHAERENKILLKSLKNSTLNPERLAVFGSVDNIAGAQILFNRTTIELGCKQLESFFANGNSIVNKLNINKTLENIKQSLKESDEVVSKLPDVIRALTLPKYRAFSETIQNKVGLTNCWWLEPKKTKSFTLPTFSSN